MTVRLTSARELARVLGRSPRTLARWCEDGDVEHTVRGSGKGKRYMIVVRNGIVRVCGTEIPINDKTA